MADGEAKTWYYFFRTTQRMAFRSSDSHFQDFPLLLKHKWKNSFKNSMTVSVKIAHSTCQIMFCPQHSCFQCFCSSHIARKWQFHGLSRYHRNDLCSVISPSDDDVRRTSSPSPRFSSLMGMVLLTVFHLLISIRVRLRSGSLSFISNTFNHH